MDNEEFEIDEEVASGSNKSGMDRLLEIFNENKKLIIIVGVVILLLIILSAVTKSSDSKTIKLSESEKTITTASGVTLELLVNDVKTTSGVTWESSDTKVATVDNSGTVHGVSAGQATITATYEGEKYKCEVTVTNGDAGIKVESIKFSEGTIVMSVGSKYTPAVEVEPSEAQIRNKYFYSSDRNVATVDISTGEITANQLGTANIRVSVNDAEKMTSAKLQVISGEITPGFYILPTSIKLSENDLTMTEGERKAITFTQEPENSSKDYVNWVSSDPTIATVENNEIVALRAGEAEIAVTSFGVNDKVKVHIKSASVEVTSVSLTSSSSVSMKVGDTKQIKAKVVPSNATNKELLYDSSNPSVVAVDSVGNITGVSGGEATVTVKSASKPDLYATVNVSVEDDTTPTDPVTPTDPGGGGGGGTTTTVGTAKLTSNNDAVESSVSALSGKTMTSTKLTITTSGNVDKVLYCNYEYQKQSDCTTYMVYSKPFDFNTPGTFVFKVIPYYNNNAGTTLVRYVKISGSGTTTGKCPAGKYLSVGTCYSCPAGYYCANDKKIACPAGTGSVANSSMPSNCEKCAKGYYSTGDGKGCVACPSGKTTSGTGATSSSQCNVDVVEQVKCSAGKYYDGKGNCVTCPAGYYCPGVTFNKGSTTEQGKTACPSGYTSPTGSTSSSQCTKASTQVKCSAGKYYDGKGNCVTCTAGYYCPGVTFTQGSTSVQGRTQCPSGTTSAAGSDSSDDCKSSGGSNSSTISYSIPSNTTKFNTTWGSYPFVALNNVKTSKNYNLIAFCYYIIGANDGLNSSKCSGNTGKLNKMDSGMKGGRMWFKMPTAENKWYVQELSSEMNNANFYFEAQQMNDWGHGYSNGKHFVLVWTVGSKDTDGKNHLTNKYGIIRIKPDYKTPFVWPMQKVN